MYECDEVYSFSVAIYFHSFHLFISSVISYFPFLLFLCIRVLPHLSLACSFISFIFYTHFSAHYYMGCIPSVIPHHVQQLHLLVEASMQIVLNNSDDTFSDRMCSTHARGNGLGHTVISCTHPSENENSIESTQKKYRILYENQFLVYESKRRKKKNIRCVQRPYFAYFPRSRFTKRVRMQTPGRKSFVTFNTS